MISTTASSISSRFHPDPAAASPSPWSSTVNHSRECGRSSSSSFPARCSLQERINQLKLSRSSLDPLEYVDLLGKCAEVKSSAAGRAIHDHIVSSGCEANRYLKNHLIFMYARCGCLADAVAIFSSLSDPNVFSWTAVITAYAQAGHLREALRLCWTMQLQGTKPDAFVFSTALAACSSAGALEQGQAIHSWVVAAGMEAGVVGNAIINLYGKCGKVDEANNVFLRLPERNIVSWNALIAANAQNGHYKNALQAFFSMDLDGSVRPNDASYVSVLDACSSALDLPLGRAIHERIIRTGYDSFLFVGNSLINMYGKCGDTISAKHVFKLMRCRDVLSWTCLIAAFALNGHRKDALEWYRNMDLEGIPPNDITFVSILFACGHSGLVYQGRDFFVSMVEDHCIVPTMEHYGCMIDLLARAGWLDYAKQLIDFNPFGHQSFEWLTLLGACKTYGDKVLAKKVAKEVIERNPKSASPYMLLVRTQKL